MTSQVTTVSLLATTSVLLCTCLVGNIFILEVIVSHHSQAAILALPTNELIIGSLAMSNILNGVFSFFWLVVYLFRLCQRAGGWLYQVLDFATMTVSSTSFWYTASLSAFYTLKISSVSPPRITHLMVQFPKAMPAILLFMLLACSIFSGPAIAYIRLKEPNGSDLHCGDYYEASGAYMTYSSAFNILSCLLPLVILTICSVFLVTSLCRHSRRMGGGPRAAVHLRVAKMALVLFGFYALCVVCAQVSNELYVATDGTGDWFVTYSVVQLIYSSGCPLVIIWGTVRLHHRLLKLYNSLRCCKTLVLQDGSTAADSPASPIETTRCSSSAVQ
ncbi:hypothetical protein NDU88_000886 [Pleurodeles waltl]|uniref:Taste receptor type 2 n=1 Tax=Pleurodeles waltl TaxID=8319 RepID=A0AAV7P2A8_PLEWA|nr:hypothetical protein NDU88_000886 [Pleurodeles waltl]